MKPTALDFYTRPGCRLCDRLLALIEDRLRDADAVAEVSVSKRNVDADPEWEQRYGQRIPVVTLEGRIVLEGHPTPREVEQAVAGLLLREARSAEG